MAHFNKQSTVFVKDKPNNDAYEARLVWFTTNAFLQLWLLATWEKH